MKRKIKVLFVSAEISPYANAGGLGEVGRSLPIALTEAGDVEMYRIMPRYQCVDTKLEYVTDFPVPMDQSYETCVLKKDPDSNGIPTYFIENSRLYHRDSIYAYDDDGFRFFFFCKAVVETLKRVSFHPDIVHMNDWHTGFLALLLKKEFPKIKTVYTIHNISYHGFIPSSYLRGYLTKEEEIELGYPEWLNFMKAGIKYADLVTTVSPGYAVEISQEAFSNGMSDLIAKRSDKLVGILNGIDTVSYDPKQDEVLQYPYDSNSLELKKKNRALLRKEYGLPDENIPLVAMITRLDYAKGIDLLLKAVSYLPRSTFQLIIMGTGNPYYQGMLACVSAAYGDNIIVDFNYSAEQARKIYAATDIYLMPSLYEPCGLGQLYAMKYGAVPVVNAVGGLKDTVIDDPIHRSESSGFYMEDWSGEALSRAMKRAIDAYHSPIWKNYMQNCMSYNSTWERSVSEYRRCYEQLIVKE